MNVFNQYDIDDISTHPSIPDNHPLQVSNALIQSECEDGLELLQSATRSRATIISANVSFFNDLRDLWTLSY